MRHIIKRTGVSFLILAILLLTAGCITRQVGNKTDFSGTWEGTISLEGQLMPGKMVLQLDGSGRGRAQFGFVDQLTRDSINVLLTKENALTGDGAADNMAFELDGKFYEMDDEWVFAGQLAIVEGDETSYTTVEFYREGSASILKPEDLLRETSSSAAVTPEQWGNSIDFAGEWTGEQMIAEISGAKADDFKDMEGASFECHLLLNLVDYSSGSAELYLYDEHVGSGLEAVAANDRLMLSGLLWGGPFEWNGTFEYDPDEETWTLTGGGDIIDDEAEAVFHVVMRLSQTTTEKPPDRPAETTGSGNSPRVDAPLDEFLIGCWMAPPSNVMVERKILALYYDGIAESNYAKPGSHDTEETWLTGSWQLDEPAQGTWSIKDGKLVAEFENDSLSFTTDVRIIDEETIEIEVFYTRTEYRRLPVS